MIPLSKAALRGNWATLLLPLNADDSIDHALLAEELERLVAAGVDGIYSNGTAGEFHTQTEDEFDRIHELVAATCEKRGMPFQIGASHMSAQLSRERVRRARALRPSAFQIILPDWIAPSWSEVVAFLEAMAAMADPVPLVLYNPPHAKRGVSPDEWLRLAHAVPRLVGIKVAGGDDAWYSAMRPVFERLAVFVPGHALASGLARGAHGSFSNVACLSPSGAQRWCELCRADPAAGLRWEGRIRGFWAGSIEPLITRHGLCNAAADKAAACAGGWLPGLIPRLRWPYRSADPALVDAIAAAARAELPELLAPAP